MNSDSQIESDWLPIDLDLTSPMRSIKWLAFENKRLSEPFFSQSIRMILEESDQRRIRETSLHALASIGLRLSPITPSGLIFHVSRCGSTLIANALRTVESSLVISEAPVMTKVLYPHSTGFWPYSASAWCSVARGLMDSLVRIVGHHHGQTEKQRVIVKFTSWNILEWRVVRSLWPSVPALVVVREPEQVIASHMRSPGGFMKWDRSVRQLLFGCLSEDMTDEEYCAFVIGCFCDATTECMKGSMTRIMRYEDINPSSLSELAKRFDIDLKPDSSHLRQVFATYSKDPKGVRPFPGHHGLDNTVTREIVLAADKWAGHKYRKLSMG
jgi:hypothetical protein